MIRIAPVNLAFNPKTLWFAAEELPLDADSVVVVETARGVELGRMTGEVFEVDQEKVDNLKSPLKPVLRVATPEDVAKARELEAKNAEALPVFKEMVAELEADMRPISVEFLLDGDKAVFYFEAEERVDFRELVRKLAAYFHVRIDMRQIGVRDEARMVGGIGHCGQELCCKRLGCEFCPVSIRMAKEQDLSLNPQKISGVCGRLMCCLRYEFEAYKDFKTRAPKVGASIETPDGVGKVVDLDTPREIVTIKLEGENPVKVPLSDFEVVEEEGKRPSMVGSEAWEAALNPETEDSAIHLSIFSTTELTTSEKLAEPQAMRRSGDLEKGSLDTVSGATRRSRRRSSGEGKSAARDNRSRSNNRSEATPEAAPTRRSRRRSTKVGTDGSVTSTQTVPEATLEQAQRSTRRRRGGDVSAGGSPDHEKQGSRSRRERNRNRTANERQGSDSGNASKGESGTHESGTRNDATARGNRPSQAQGAGRGKGGRGGRSRADQGISARSSAVRPGRNSSALRQRKGEDDGAMNRQADGLRSAVSTPPKKSGGFSGGVVGSDGGVSSNGHRRPRRRSRSDGNTSSNE